MPSAAKAGEYVWVMVASSKAVAAGVDRVETNPESVRRLHDAKRLVEAIQGASLDKVGAVWAVLRQERVLPRSSRTGTALPSGCVPGSVGGHPRSLGVVRT